VARSDGAGGAKVVTPSVGDDYTILDHELEVFLPNRSVPDGYGEPYFTDRNAMAPSAMTSPKVPASLILHYPDFTRAVVFEQIFDVFDRRSEPKHAGIGPIGARLALSPFPGPQTTAEVDTGSSFFFQAFNYREPGPRRRTGSGAQFDHKERGRCSMAVFRCCGQDGTVERFSVLRRMSMSFDFAPTGTPPAGAVSIGDGKYPVLTPDQQVRIASQALAIAATRWNGTEDRDSQPVIDPLDPTAPAVAPLDVSTHRPEIEVGNPVVARGRHVVLFTRAESSTATHTHVPIRLWENVRASMPYSATDSDWDLADLSPRLVDDKGNRQRRYVIAHELGHALGLPDEYGENDHHASMGGVSISDRARSAGLPYNKDGSTGAGGEDGAASMMRSDHVPRNRHFWGVVPWLVHDAGMFAGHEMTVVRGDHRYTLPVTARDEVPNYYPVAATAARKGTVFRRKGLCDVFMYRTGHDAFTATGLKGASDGPFDALIAARLKLALDLPGYSFDEARAVATDLTSYVDRTFTNTNGVFAECTLDGVPLRARVLVSTRVVVRTLPPTSGLAEEQQLDEYLRKLEYYSQAKGKLTVPSASDRLAAREALSTHPTRLAEAEKKAKEAREGLEGAEADSVAAQHKHEAAKKARDEGSLPAAEADKAVAKAQKDEVAAFMMRSYWKGQVTAADKVVADLEKEREAMTEAIIDARSKIAKEHKELVDTMIEEEHVHAIVVGERKGITRFTDAKSVPRKVRARLRPVVADLAIETNDRYAFDRIAGKLLGLLTPGGFPPAWEFEALCRLPTPKQGQLKIDRVRRVK